MGEDTINLVSKDWVFAKASSVNKTSLSAVGKAWCILWSVRHILMIASWISAPVLASGVNQALLAVTDANLRLDLPSETIQLARIMAVTNMDD